MAAVKGQPYQKLTDDPPSGTKSVASVTLADDVAAHSLGLVGEATEHLRELAGSSVRRLLVDPDAPVPVSPMPAEDNGLFGPDSITWKVHGHMSVLVGGIRSLLVQTLHPLAMAGVADHSDYRHDSLGRLQRTGRFIAVTTYGTTQEAERAIAAVHRAHERVRGLAPDGRQYYANDPDLLAWVHHVEVESFLLAYQRLGPGLSPADADRYVSEMAVLGERMGVISPMRNVPALRAWVQGHPEQRATTEAHKAVRFLLAPPLPLAAQAPYTVIIAAAIGLIPLAQRAQLRLFLPGPLASRVAVAPAARLLVSAMGWVMGPSPAQTNALARAQTSAA